MLEDYLDGLELFKGNSLESYELAVLKALRINRLIPINNNLIIPCILHYKVIDSREELFVPVFLLGKGKVSGRSVGEPAYIEEDGIYYLENISKRGNPIVLGIVRKDIISIIPVKLF